jgi:cytochrome c-type biogenesis protein
MNDLSVWLAFGAGVLSFVSPCCLPLYPSFLSYITGISVAQLQESDRTREVTRIVILHTLFFIMGFSLVFYALGFTATWVGKLFTDYKDLVRMLSAVLIIAMGLFVTGVFQPKFLMREKRLEVSKKGFGYFSSLLIGIGFAAGWTPCIGPILTSVILLAATEPGLGMIYITAFTLGFAIPFFLMAFFIGKTKWILKYSAKIMKIGGYVMVLFGILLYTDQMTFITKWLIKITGFTGF